MKGFEEKIKEIDALYSKATKEADYLEIEEKAQALEKEMVVALKGIDETANAILNGFWASYYLARKFDYVDSLLTHRVVSYYLRVENPEVKVAYGYLLAVIASELREDFVAAKKINGEIQKIAEETGNITSLLRVISARGLSEMKEKNFVKAVEIFNEIDKLKTIPVEAFRHAGNIINNRGWSKVQGDIDILGGMEDLVRAVKEYYLKEAEISRKHVEGIANRLHEGGKKLAQKISQPSL